MTTHKKGGIAALCLWLIAISFMILTGCTSVPVEVSADVTGNIVLDQPEIVSVNINESTLTANIIWTMDSMDTVYYFDIYISPPDDPTTTLFLTGNIMADSSPISFNYNAVLEEGLGTYNFRVRAVDITLVEGMASDAYPALYEGLLGYNDSVGSILLDGPSDVAIDSNDNIFVLDTNNHRIIKYNSSGVIQDILGEKGSGNWQFDRPEGLCIDAFDNLYVADSGNDRIVGFDPDVFEVGIFSEITNDFSQPSDCAISDDSVLVVTDKQNNKVHVLKDSSWSSFGSFGTGDGMFKGPGYVGIYQNLIYVTDQGNHRINVFDLDGIFQRSWGTFGNGYGEFSVPTGLYVNGQVYVTEEGNDRLQIFDTDGTFLGLIGTNGDQDGEFNDPKGLTGKDSIIVVADSRNNRVQILNQVEEDE